MSPTTPLLLVVSLSVLSGCGLLSSREPAPVAVPPASTPKAASERPPAPAPSKRGGGYYLDDGPGDNPPDNLDAIPNAVPVAEPLHRFANKPYTVLGRNYVPINPGVPYKKQGIASWYGRKFHGQKTSSGEPYDMYGMTAAHPTLPIPSYVRVSNPANARQVVVRVNDRGPFHADRIIDLSYTAAWKLGYIGSGSTAVEVELLQPDGASTAPTTLATADPLGRLAAASSATPPAGAATLPSVRDSGGTWLQLGAFGNQDNAAAFLAHMQRQLEPGLSEKLSLRSDARLHRVQLGPYPDLDAARRAAETLHTVLGTPPLVVKP